MLYLLGKNLNFMMENLVNSIIKNRNHALSTIVKSLL